MPDGKPLSAPQKALIKLGLARDVDLALHLPLRYEDETRITPLNAAREGEAAQVEGTITACEIAYRPRRQLVATLDDGTGTCQLRFFSFYPAQQKALAPGTRILRALIHLWRRLRTIKFTRSSGAGKGKKKKKK